MSIQDDINRMAANAPESATEGVTSVGEAIAMSGMLQRLEARTERKCATCGETFEAVGFQGYCDVCSIAIDEAAAKPPMRKFDSTWPRLHVDKIPEMVGPSLQMAKRLADRMYGNRMLILAGDRGRGKTQIAAYIAYHRMSKGHDSGLYFRAYDACNSIVGHDREAKLLAFQKVPFLVLDEAHKIEAKLQVTLESIIDARYSNKKPTVVIGNWMTEKGIQSGEIVGEQRLFGLGPTLMDRINEHQANRTGGVVWCRWGSYRRNDQTYAKSNR